ncbi:unnamed protein product [Microthlaspi erraticum]|uniref:Uncharacterized protein n=1 Tax=Microthlaspi erraticum TaxID=1685480 RepID=A0A6D2IRN6_9BRAS|nr:unnamed protein product [Microthlaspi erraticum]CAA7034452.1 unnamed protein product [Microthlaspi erraticum]
MRFSHLKPSEFHMQPKAINILMGYGRKSMWKHGSQSLMLFMPKVASSSVRFGMMAVFIIYDLPLQDR